MCASNLEAVEGDHAECNPPKNMVYICQPEFMKYAKAADSSIAYDTNKQFFTQEEYSSVKAKLLSDYQFLLGLCA